MGIRYEREEKTNEHMDFKHQGHLPMWEIRREATLLTGDASRFQSLLLPPMFPCYK